jgi:hypothetical protein
LASGSGHDFRFGGKSASKTGYCRCDDHWLTDAGISRQPNYRRGILDHTFNHPVRTSLPPFAAPIDQRPSSLAVAALCVAERNLTDEQEQD